MKYNFKIYGYSFPETIEEDLINIYSSSYCTYEYFKGITDLNSNLDIIYYFEDEKLKHCLGFNILSNEIVILNRLFFFDEYSLKNISNILFKQYPETEKIIIELISNKLIFKKNYFEEKFKSNDMVISLPENFDLYTNSLGKQTKKHLKYYVNRIQKTFVNYNFKIIEKSDITREMISNIITLNRARMQDKGVVSGIDFLYEERIFKQCITYGFLGIIYINEEIVGGTICYKIRDEFFLQTIAHSPNYNKYNVGQIALYLTINESILIKGKRFHLLWGKSEYKVRFGGTEAHLYSYNIYSSKFNFFKNKISKKYIYLREKFVSQK